VCDACVEGHQDTIEAIVDMAAMTAYWAQQSGVVVAYLFGSVALGRADTLSDVDVAVLLEERLEGERGVDAQLRFTGGLAGCSERDVQVVLLNQASPLLAYQVVQDGVLLYERSRAERLNFEVRTRRVYFDWRPWSDFHTRALIADIKEVGLSGRAQRCGGALEAARRVHQRLAGVAER
jgi:predicted nucleotidyltransferase